jgi:predicted nucleotidyltransferase
VLEIIFSEVQQFRATKLSAKRANSRVLKVILYGSYARGDWVEDHSSGYRSDYDILIAVNSEAFAQEQELWLSLDERLLQEQIAHRIKPPVIPVVHSLHDINDQLSRGRPFFVDIKRFSTRKMAIPSPNRSGRPRKRRNPRRDITLNSGPNCRPMRSRLLSLALSLRDGGTVPSCCIRRLRKHIIASC